MRIEGEAEARLCQSARAEVKLAFHPHPLAAEIKIMRSEIYSETCL